MLYLKYGSGLVLIALLTGCFANKEEVVLSSTDEKIALGEVLFFDKNLSKNRTQSCATCHNPQSAFTDDRHNGVAKMASLGDDGKSLGDRQAPTVSYAMFSPEFHYDEKKKKYVGGQFWDGRESSLANQAGGPPLNPVEMNMKDKEEVVQRLKENPYYVESFQKLYGKNVFKDVNKAYESMTKAIESFEQTKQFAPFDSKYDRYLKGEYDLTPLEDLGRSLFFSNNNNSSYLFNNQGNYIISLINSNQYPSGQCFDTADFHYFIYPHWKDSIQINPVLGCDPLTVNFNLNDTNVIYKTLFGDGQTSNLTQMIHTYQNYLTNINIDKICLKMT